MKRFAIFISLHLFLFLLVIAYQAQASDDEWVIDRFETTAYARVSGEIIYEDRLNFFIQASRNCEKVWQNFTFYTYEDSGDIKQLINKHIPIKINGEAFTAEVNTVSPFLMGWRVMFTLGVYPLKEYIYHLNQHYLEEKKYEIEIVDGINFSAAKYFDIRKNSWKLDQLVPSVLQATKLCRELSQKQL